MLALALASCSPEPDTQPVPGDEVIGQERDDGPPDPPAPGPDDDVEPVPEDEAEPGAMASPSRQEQVSDDHPRWGGGVVRLADARLISLEGLDRFVLEFENGLPSWRVRPVTGPIVEQPGRSEVDLVGDSYLEVRLVPATTVDREADEPMDAYEGPSFLSGDDVGIREAALTTDASDIVVFSLGLAGAPSFAVTTLEEPERLVVDVVAEG